MKKLVYISHPSSGTEENKLDVERIIRELYKNEYIRERYTFVSPIHSYGFMYFDVDYTTGLDYCIELLEHCDTIFVFGAYKSSIGCLKEIEYSAEHNIETFIFGECDLADVEGILRDSNTDKIYIENKNKIINAKTVYTFASKEELESSTDMKDVVKDKVFYDTVNTLFSAVEFDNDSMVLIEVTLPETRSDNILDFTNNDDIHLFRFFLKKNMWKFNEDNTQEYLIKKFVEASANKYLYVKTFSRDGISIVGNKCHNVDYMCSKDRIDYRLVDVNCIDNVKIITVCKTFNSDGRIISTDGFYKDSED